MSLLPRALVHPASVPLPFHSSEIMNPTVPLSAHSTLDIYIWVTSKWKTNDVKLLSIIVKSLQYSKYFCHNFNQAGIMIGIQKFNMCCLGCSIGAVGAFEFFSPWQNMERMASGQTRPEDSASSGHCNQRNCNFSSLWRLSNLETLCSKRKIKKGPSDVNGAYSEAKRMN